MSKYMNSLWEFTQTILIFLKCDIIITIIYYITFLYFKDI